MTSANKDSKILLGRDLDRQPVDPDAVLFIQTEGAPRSADSTATVLFIQTEDVLAKKKIKNLKVERVCAAHICVLGWRSFNCCIAPCIYSNKPTPGRIRDVLRLKLPNLIRLGFSQSRFQWVSEASSNMSQIHSQASSAPPHHSYPNQSSLP